MKRCHSHPGGRIGVLGVGDGDGVAEMLGDGLPVPVPVQCLAMSRLR